MIFSNALHDIAEKQERTLYGRVAKSLGGDPQTLPAGVRSSCASKKPKLLTQQASPGLGGDVPLFVEHCEAVAAKVDVKRRWHGEQGRHVSF
jgi:hypothetical protein